MTAMDEERSPGSWEPPPPWGTEAAFLLVACDFALLLLLPPSWTLAARAGVALAFPVLFLALGKNPFVSMGIRTGSAMQGIKACGAAVLVTSVLVGIGAGVFFGLRAAGVNLVLPPPAGSGPQRLLALLLTVGAYPLLEEWIYRGVLYPTLEIRTGRVPAIVLSGLVFQALHLAYGKVMPHYFIGGMILAWAFARGRSLIYPVLLHALWNLFVAGIDIARAEGILTI